MAASHRVFHCHDHASLWFSLGVGLLVAALSTALALVLPMHRLEPFLLLLSSVCVPLFGVILGRLAFGTLVLQRRQQAAGVHWPAVGLWLAGIAFFHLLPPLTTAFGSALPTLLLCFGLSWATRPAALKPSARTEPA